MSLRVLVTGGVAFTDRERVFAVMDRFRDRFGVALVIHREAPGVAKLAGEWAEAREVPCSTFALRPGAAENAEAECNWRMLRMVKAERVIVFPGETGTLAEQARGLGVEVIEIPPRRETP